MVLDAKRAFLHADALTETYVKPPTLGRHRTMLVIEKGVCMAHFLQRQDCNTSFEELAQTVACSAQAIVLVHSDTRREIWIWSCIVMVSTLLEMETT